MSIPVRHTVGSLAAIVGGVLLTAASALGQSADGLFVTVPNPITTEGVNRIKAIVGTRIDPAAPQRAGTVVFDFNPDGKPAATADFGACLSLQDYILNTVNRNGVNTVAFVHAPTSAHTVLPVLACRELVMSPGATLGQVTDDGNPPLVPPLNASKETLYRETLAAVGRGGLVPVVRKMYDPAVQLRRGIPRVPPLNPVYFDAADPEQVKNIAGGPNFPPVEGVADGQVSNYTARQAIALGLAKATAETRTDVAAVYGIPGISRDDPLEGRTPDVYFWAIKKDIDGSVRESVNRVIRDVRQKGGNVLILVINVGGNDLVAARNLADDLRAAQTGDDKIKIVAFVTEHAPAAGTVVALGCSEIVVAKPKPDALGDAKEADLGDFAAYIKATRQADVEANLGSVRDLARAQGYPEILIDGMFRHDLEILRVKPAGNNLANQRRFMSREDFEKAKAEWVEDKVVKPKGQLLKLTAQQAVEYGIARVAVEGTDVKAVTTAFGWPDAKSPDPGWLDKFADFLRNPTVTVLLVVLGFTGLILELKLPGLTVPGIIAALCFILVFWAHSKFSGQTFALALLLFLLGLALVGIEIFVLPGFGACGIFGILCMLAGLGIVTMDKVPATAGEWGRLGERVSVYLFAMIGAFVLAFTIARFLPKIPGGNRLVLNAPVETGSPAEALPGGGEAAELLGAVGTTNTPLRPAGMVKFGDKFVDVVSDGGFVPAGTRVQVIQVEGTRIVVKEV
ncbi:Membrane-bound serine protease (ClpP class) OS=Singulisphaera acidiphila (strain ATCC BAA-1392 / DSM 18658 / VKM B-2454 / MOB10) GN=Sinac_1414 PE=4 SV=1: NfeD [Gemmataceae bacterium]|nr:Membrane-bound serine protease (ClpP class) OS=Singulisphaera acidiphila (strain ATCC BAA-1392 / DSM 18658 / VKM B-2454 / MOB10) GN=Sinac_1414 PE=4 SV=1: NfeD [Gemmataceae bacterium]VTU02368.1 Membrane-bound serine protease (ClpP class) OS=Singulisphaera acidiphila (strain ATCC BAA-1392 / DSM 18658 / VKM B-2454 / MOB10) GN=Sinac_1414 PE=4 SV=1: NfeD [Gemmataceae bacterium]